MHKLSECSLQHYKFIFSAEKQKTTLNMSCEWNSHVQLRSCNMVLQMSKKLFSHLCQMAFASCYKTINFCFLLHSKPLILMKMQKISIIIAMSVVYKLQTSNRTSIYLIDLMYSHFPTTNNRHNESKGKFSSQSLSY